MKMVMSIDENIPFGYRFRRFMFATVFMMFPKLGVKYFNYMTYKEFLSK
jgi:hypothetical protein